MCAIESRSTFFPLCIPTTLESVYLLFYPIHFYSVFWNAHIVRMAEKISMNFILNGFCSRLLEWSFLQNNFVRLFGPSILRWKRKTNATKSASIAMFLCRTRPLFEHCTQNNTNVRKWTRTEANDELVHQLTKLSNVDTHFVQICLDYADVKHFALSFSLVLQIFCNVIILRMVQFNE